MDDRAKMLQYFAKSNDETANISIEDLFQRSPLRWSYVTMLHDVSYNMLHAMLHDMKRGMLYDMLHAMILEI